MFHPGPARSRNQGAADDSRLGASLCGTSTASVGGIARLGASTCGTSMARWSHSARTSSRCLIQAEWEGGNQTLRETILSAVELLCQSSMSLIQARVSPPRIRFAFFVPKIRPCCSPAASLTCGVCQILQRPEVPRHTLFFVFCRSRSEPPSKSSLSLSLSLSLALYLYTYIYIYIYIYIHLYMYVTYA